MLEYLFYTYEYFTYLFVVFPGVVRLAGALEIVYTGVVDLVYAEASDVVYAVAIEVVYTALSTSWVLSMSCTLRCRCCPVLSTSSGVIDVV